MTTTMLNLQCTQTYQVTPTAARPNYVIGINMSKLPAKNHTTYLQHTMVILQYAPKCLNQAANITNQGNTGHSMTTASSDQHPCYPTSTKHEGGNNQIITNGANHQARNIGQASYKRMSKASSWH